jgi:hypothetical protein
MRGSGLGYTTEGAPCTNTIVCEEGQGVYYQDEVVVGVPQVSLVIGVGGQQLHGEDRLEAEVGVEGLQIHALPVLFAFHQPLQGGTEGRQSGGSRREGWGMQGYGPCGVLDAARFTPLCISASAWLGFEPSSW